MSVKSQFLQKLQARQTSPARFTSKSQADIATFRLRMEQLHEQMDAWLAETGLSGERLSASVTDLLVESGAFDIPAILVRYENRAIKFMPIFLYGHGVTGCAEATLHADGAVTSLGRLFMRAGQISDWTFISLEGRPRQRFDEERFFELIARLLP
ncbi:hypothetical protein [Pantoea sp. C2G6]|uniref:hypothetical protein n=1 Tax=Pantoea sp. C2G6 TaxID=3243084 RepID=UPI003EDB1C64